MVMMPLVPGFAGELDDPSASLPRVIMNWQYKTICRGENSLLGRIMKETDTPQLGNYIQFYGLRNHAVINDKPYTEIIYLHSKLMIVDDRYLICGSANINDRSMEGNRDS
jgi:phospholipase D1/2